MPLTTLSRPEAPAAAPRSPLDLTSLQRSLPRWNFGVALFLTGLAGFLHLYLYSQHYPLWRDEVGTAQLANCPTVAETWKLLPFDSCPLLMLGLARVWSAMFPGVEDWHLRMLGTAVGLAVLGAVWLCARAFGARVPLLTIALLGFNPAVVRYGDSVRPYGVGMLLALLAALTVWRAVENARPGRIALAALVGVLAVNAVFYNAVLLLVLCVSGAVVVLTQEKSWRKAALILSIGGPAALALLVYAPMIREQHRWAVLLSHPVDAAWLWQRLSEATGSPDPIGVWVWPSLVVGVAGWAGWYFVGQGRPAQAWKTGDRAAAFAGLTLVLGIVGYALFLKVLRYHTQPWYYVALLALAAVCLDALYAQLADASPHAARWQVARLLFVLGFTALTFTQARQELFTRPTNLDVVARAAAARATKDDLIVHARWECAITFNEYYHGVAPQETLPPLADHRMHRYDLVIDRMMTANPAQPVLDRMAQTLRDGHRIFFVGVPALPPPGMDAPVLKPIFRGPKGWHGDGDYYTAWAMQASVLLERHATRVEMVPTPVGQPVSHYENLPLCILQGWKP